MKSFIFASLLIFSSNVFSYDCDCTKIVGNCTGSAVLTESSGGNGSYRGEVEISSSTLTCSKVDYFVNNTPYSTILNNKNRDVESIFGTNQIKKGDVQFKACYVCLKKENYSSSNSIDDNANNPFVGRWTGIVSWMLVSDSITVVINDNNGTLSGTWQTQGKQAKNLTAVNVAGKVMTVNFIGEDNGLYTYVFTLNGVSSASVKGDGLISFSGVVNKVM